MSFYLDAQNNPIRDKLRQLKVQNDLHVVEIDKLKVQNDLLVAEIDKLKSPTAPTAS